MTTEGTKYTVGKTIFLLFRIEHGIPCQNAREQAS